MGSKEPIKAVIVGAGGGIGTSVCQLIAESGGEAFLIGRDSAKLHAIASRFGWGFAAADAADWDELDRMVSSAEGLLGNINAAINLAGSVLLKPMHLTTQAEWEKTVRTNLTTAAGLVRCCVPRMFTNGGSIVLMSSAAENVVLKNHEALAASKAGIDGLVRSAATTYASKRIRINSIAPGLVKTPLTERIWSTPRSAEASLSMHPIGRFGEPEDIARAIVWFASPEQSWVTGQTLGVECGLGSLKTIAAPSTGAATPSKPA